MMVIPRVFLICVCGRGGFHFAPLFGLTVVRVAFWCSGAVEPLLFTLWPPVRWRGPPRLANFDFRALFSGTLKDFFLLGALGSCLLLGGRGGLYYPLLPGCGLFVDARRGRLSFGSLRLDDGGRKIVSSCRGLVCMDSVPVTLNGDFV